MQESELGTCAAILTNGIAPQDQNKEQTKEAGVPYSIDIPLVPAAVSRPYHNKVTLYALTGYEAKSLRGIASRVGG